MKYLQDIIGILGFILLIIGVSLQFNWTIGLIVAGTLMLLLAIFIHPKEKTE